MLVETFLSEDALLSPDEQALAVSLADRLNLPAQCDLYKKSGGRTVPFTEITAEQSTVWKICFPRATDISEWKQPLPLRVLEVYERALELKDANGNPFFCEYTIWAPEMESDKDPILLGIHIPDPARSWTKNTYPLCRWGECLDEWPALVKQAREILRGRLSSVIEKYKLQLKQLDNCPIRNINDSSPYFPDVVRI